MGLIQRLRGLRVRVYPIEGPPWLWRVLVVGAGEGVSNSASIEAPASRFRKLLHSLVLPIDRSERPDSERANPSAHRARCRLPGPALRSERMVIVRR